MQLTCPKCSRPIPGEDIHLERGTALCKPCGELIAVPHTAPVTYKPLDFRWSEVVDGGNFHATGSNDRAAMAKRNAVFAALILVAVLRGISGALRRQGRVDLWPIALMMLVGIVFLAPVARKVLNRAAFDFVGGTLRFRTAPIPPAKQIEVHDVVRFEKYAATKVAALRRDASVVPLEHDFGSGDHADYAVYRLNELLAETRGFQGNSGYRVSSVAPRANADEASDDEVKAANKR